MSKWISVEERLPRSVTKKVLVWAEHDDLGGYIGFAYYIKFMGEEEWLDLETGERFDKRGWRVTYWRPLPKPPKEETK